MPTRTAIKVKSIRGVITRVARKRGNLIWDRR